MLAAVFNMLGALLVGHHRRRHDRGDRDRVGRGGRGRDRLGCARGGPLEPPHWWRGLPSSSAHALVGGLVGAALVEGGIGAVQWGGLNGWRPVGVFGVLIALAVSPLIGLALGFVFIRLSRLVLRRATRRVRGPILGAEWGMAAGLSFSHGANDAQKSMGVDRCVAARCGQTADVRCSALGEGRLRGRDHARNSAGRMANRPHSRPWDLPPRAGRRFRAARPARLRSSSPPRTWGLRSRPPTSSSLRSSGSALGGAAGGTSAGPSSDRSPSPGS